jgi:NAD-dependent DNA ligase
MTPNQERQAQVPQGGKILEKFEKIRHKSKQRSFDNVFDFNELEDWDIRNKRILEKE